MPNEQVSAIKRQRVSKACEQCRKKKVKCDGIPERCSNCVSLNLTCTYKETTKKRGPPKGYIEAIEGRLHRLEALLGSIIQEDDPRSQAILAELNAPLQTAYGELVRPKPAVPLGSEEENMNNMVAIEDNNNNKSSEDANDNLGNLSMDEGGQLRYYGKSSGFYMLKNSKTFQNGAFHFNNSKQESSEMIVDPYELPPKDLSSHLLDLYFTHFYPLLPLLYKKSFLASLDSTPSLLLLNAIYAVASRISTDIRVRANPELKDTAGDVFFERAKILLDLEWDNFKVSTVQSLLLLSSHQNGALKNIRGWLYSGMAFRMCQNLGLNRNCDDWNLSSQEKEERKRVFYCCFVVDRLTCAMHGRAPMIDDRDLDTPYPTVIDQDEPTIMDNFHQLIKLCEILGDILTQLYMVRGRNQMRQMAFPDMVISKLDKALNKWMAKLPASIQYRPPNTKMAEKLRAPRLELCQVHMLFYTALILLHRPFIPNNASQKSTSIFPSASICTFAANKILDIVECLMSEEGRLQKVNNYTLFYMFTAGIIFINDALSSDPMFAFEAKISINKIIKAMDEIETTWMTSARHCNILAELAGLRDINLTNIDQQQRKQKEKEMVSIAVPNSPVMHDEVVNSLLEFSRNPIDIQRGIPLENKFPAYIQQQQSTYVGTPPPPTSNMPQQQQSYQQQDPNASFNPANTAFFGIPMSFDIDEWNSYFSEQQQQQQQQQEQS